MLVNRLYVLPSCCVCFQFRLVMVYLLSTVVACDLFSAASDAVIRNVFIKTKSYIWMLQSLTEDKKHGTLHMNTEMLSFLNQTTFVGCGRPPKKIVLGI